MAKKYVKQVAEYSAASQTTDIASQILFTTDHAGFYRINAMIKMSGLNSANANISANTDAAIYSGSLVTKEPAGSLVSCDGDPSFNSFVTYINNNVNFTFWVKSPNYSLFTSYDFSILIEDFET